MGSMKAEDHIDTDPRVLQQRRNGGSFHLLWEQDVLGVTLVRVIGDSCRH